MNSKKKALKDIEFWIDQASKDLSDRELIQLFIECLRGLWVQANTIVSDVTLKAIFDRVLFNSTEKFPIFLPVQVSEKGLSFEHLLQLKRGKKEIVEGFKFLIFEFLRIMENISGGVITDPLYPLLSKVLLKSSTKNSKVESGHE